MRGGRRVRMYRIRDERSIGVLVGLFKLWFWFWYICLPLRFTFFEPCPKAINQVMKFRLSLF